MSSQKPREACTRRPEGWEVSLLDESPHVSFGRGKPRCDVDASQEQLGFGRSLLGTGHASRWSNGRVRERTPIESHSSGSSPGLVAQIPLRTWRRELRDLGVRKAASTVCCWEDEIAFWIGEGRPRVRRHQGIRVVALKSPWRVPIRPCACS